MFSVALSLGACGSGIREWPVWVAVAQSLISCREMAGRAMVTGRLRWGLQLGRQAGAGRGRRPLPAAEDPHETTVGCSE